MKTLDEAYAELLDTSSDMQYHIPKLKELAAGKRVVEFGTRRGTSTIAMLSGRPKSVIAYDFVRTDAIDEVERMAAEAGLSLEIRNEDINALGAAPKADLFFIDAFHNQPDVDVQLKLARDAGATEIAMHDTFTFARVGDMPNTLGVLDAVDDFLAANKDWRIAYHTDECNGFTVIEREL